MSVKRLAILAILVVPAFAQTPQLDESELRWLRLLSYEQKDLVEAQKAVAKDTSDFKVAVEKNHPGYTLASDGKGGVTLVSKTEQESKSKDKPQ